jgi:hypothetical protein
MPLRRCSVFWPTNRRKVEAKPGFSADHRKGAAGNCDLGAAMLGK